jgi:hypothetical protein
MTYNACQPAKGVRSPAWRPAQETSWFPVDEPGRPAQVAMREVVAPST